VVQGRLGEDVEDRAGGAGLGVGGADHDCRDAGEDDRPGAHRAGLEGDVEDRPRQAPAAERRRRGADHQHLGVGGRVAPQLALVAGGGEQLAVAEDRGADRHVAMALGPARLLERDVHRPRVLGGICHGRLELGVRAHRSGSMSGHEVAAGLENFVAGAVLAQ
jgi:hypothetical protein